MELFAMVWIVMGAVMVVVAALFLLTQGTGPRSTIIIATTACIGLPFLAFGIWGRYAELKPYRYQQRNRKKCRKV
jgi:hypothetical protein